MPTTLLLADPDLKSQRHLWTWWVKMICIIHLIYYLIQSREMKARTTILAPHKDYYIVRDAAGISNAGGLAIMWWAISAPLVVIGLYNWSAMTPAPTPPRLQQACRSIWTCTVRCVSFYDALKATWTMQLHQVTNLGIPGLKCYSIVKDSNADLTVGNWNSKKDP